MIKLSLLITAFSGAVSSLVFENKLSFVRALILTFSGTATAVFTHSMILSHFSLGENYTSGITFITGLLSMKTMAIVAAVLDKLKSNPHILLRYVRSNKSDPGANL